MGRLAWAALLAAGTLVEVRSLRRHDGCTLSETTRAVFRVHTRPGRIAFAATLGGLCCWYFEHILKPLDDAHDWEDTP